MKCKLQSYIILLITLTRPTNINSELYTSVFEVGTLLKTQQKVLDDLQFFILKEEEKLQYLKKQYNRFLQEHELAMENVDGYLGNPISAFTLIKRLTRDVNDVKEFVQMGKVYASNTTFQYEDKKFPDEDDLVGAAEGLSTLQNTYLLDVKELSNGIINGAKVSSSLNADDCYELARAHFYIKDFDSSIKWMMEALNKYDDLNTYKFKKVDIMVLISESHRHLGEVNETLSWLDKVFKLEPKNKDALKQLQLINNRTEVIQLYDEKETEDDEDTSKDRDDENEINTYMALCRGEVELPESFKKQLACRYLTENHPFLRLAPLKVEQVYKNPDIYLFHEVVSESEIKSLKALSTPNFKRGMVVNDDTGENIVNTARINKSAFLNDSESDTVAKISQKIADMTKFDMTNAEEAHVANYGIGGYYVPHHDHWDSDSKFTSSGEKYFDNRIATVLVYLSDVAQGGATVFPELGLRVTPKKGTGVFWMNLHPSGEGNLSSLHASCPVLQGSKWILTKWIRQYHQEFIYPCTLEYQPESHQPDLPKLVFKSTSN